MDAAGFLERARNHLKRVRTAVPDPTDWYDLTIYGFYCVEAAVMAAAAHGGIAVEPNHPAKAAAAANLARTRGLPDVSGLLRTLNAAAKPRHTAIEISRGSTRASSRATSSAMSIPWLR